MLNRRMSMLLLQILLLLNFGRVTMPKCRHSRVLNFPSGKVISLEEILSLYRTGKLCRNGISAIRLRNQLSRLLLTPMGKNLRSPLSILKYRMMSLLKSRKDGENFILAQLSTFSILISELRSEIHFRFRIAHQVINILADRINQVCYTFIAHRAGIFLHPVVPIR